MQDRHFCENLFIYTFYNFLRPVWICLVCSYCMLAILGSWIYVICCLHSHSLSEFLSCELHYERITKHRVIQLGFWGTEEVKPGQFRSFQTGWTNGWMSSSSSSFFIIFSKPSSPWAHIHMFLAEALQIYTLKGVALGTQRRTKPPLWLKCSCCPMNSRGVNLWYSTISARKWMQVQNHAVCVSQPNNCNDGFINIYIPVKPGNGKSPFVCYPSALILHFLMRISQTSMFKAP